jgi:hypothetical protein
LITIAGFGLYCEIPFAETIFAGRLRDGEGFDDDPSFCRCRNFNLFAFPDFSAGTGAER